jgi:hypothetical protein
MKKSQGNSQINELWHDNFFGVETFFCSHISHDIQVSVDISRARFAKVFGAAIVHVLVVNVLKWNINLGMNK